MSKNGGLDQYGTERFDRLIFATVRKSVGLTTVYGVSIHHSATDNEGD